MPRQCQCGSVAISPTAAIPLLPPRLRTSLPVLHALSPCPPAPAGASGVPCLQPCQQAPKKKGRRSRQSPSGCRQGLHVYSTITWTIHPSTHAMQFSRAPVLHMYHVEKNELEVARIQAADMASFHRSGPASIIPTSASLLKRY